ncbi:MAG: metallophosphoesterase [Planctomycetota bacterium]|jgi:predicted MPP superfamily phosphohydrolase
MTIIEKIGALVFLAIIVIVYLLEVRISLVYAINKLRGKLKVNPFVSKSALLIHLIATIGIVCFLYGYFVEPYWIEVKRIEIKTEKLREVSFKLVHISDMHCDKKVRNEKRVVELVNALNPDVIVFTGDTINMPVALATFKDTMKSLNATIGKFAVPGNYDVWYWSGLDLFSDTGFKVLEQDVVTIKKHNEVIQVSGLSVGNSELYPQVLKSVSSERFNVLLYHYPDLIEDLEDFNVDLYLAGHTHGGQVAMPLYGALVTLSKYGKKYESGKYVVGDTVLYINRGIGMEGSIAPRVRFLARPEITVINIVPERSI